MDALTLGTFLDTLGDAIAEKRPLRVLNHNMHSLALIQGDERMREIFQHADLVFIDGTPVVGIARALGHRLSFENRLAVLDWFWPLLERAAESGWRVLHVGSREPTIGRAMARVRERVPGADLLLMSGYFDQDPDSSGTARILEEIRSANPDLLLLGLGMPLQEHWLGAVSERLPPCPVVTVGGIIGFIGEERPAAPRWLGRIGMEWAFRLATEPGRLWHRYLVEPWVLARPLATELLRRDATGHPQGRP